MYILIFSDDIEKYNKTVFLTEFQSKIKDLKIYFNGDQYQHILNMKHSVSMYLRTFSLKNAKIRMYAKIFTITSKREIGTFNFYARTTVNF